jgi:MPBQ/MSBQ methyltransferase
MIAKKIALDNLVDYRQGDATNMPFGNNSFDIVWIQHASMNIADKQKLYSEIFRVLNPMGRLVIYVFFKGSNNKEGKEGKRTTATSTFSYPVPWPRDSSMSFLLSPDDARKLLKDTGVKELVWEDKTTSALEWFQQMIMRSQTTESPPAIGIHTIVGPNQDVHL